MVALNSILGYIGFLSTLIGWFLSNPDKGQVRMKYWTGRNGIGSPPLNSTGGHLPHVGFRSTAGDWIEDYNLNRPIDNNVQKQVDVGLRHNSEINFIRLYEGDGLDTDAVCLTVIGWTPNDSIPNAEYRKGYIIGDLFRLCGKAWYYSGQSIRVAGSPNNKPTFEKVDCGWFGSGVDGSVDYVNINLDVMGDGFIGHFEGQNLCYWGVDMHSAPSKRSARSVEEHVATFGYQVNVHKSLSAIKLCNSPTS
ncbi:hypothetical protein FBU30_001263 [Linnemannia zychae]|nr:hypothetical protein FBU30_001263 [Linnemannia zychae]